MKRPDFIFVGPEKTGTTWKFSQLEGHPQIALPPMKEIGYFFEAHTTPNQGFASRLLSKKSHINFMARRHARAWAKFYARNPQRMFTAEFRWRWNYLFQTHTDRWYLSCFPDLQGKLTGDITPSYFFLPPQAIQRVQKLAPDAKILISLRYPTDWLYSFAKMRERMGLLKRENFYHYFDQVLATQSFSESMKRWQRAFSESQIHVMFFDKLSATPWDYYCELCDFLEIETLESQRDKVGKIVNQGQRRNNQPSDYERYLEDRWATDIHALSQLVTLPNSWTH